MPIPVPVVLEQGLRIWFPVACVFQIADVNPSCASEAGEYFRSNATSPLN